MGKLVQSIIAPWFVAAALTSFAQPGSLDRTFYPGSVTDGTVYAVVAQTNDSILIGGDFSVADNGVSKNVARLNADGTFDPTFTSGLTVTNGPVRNIVVQTDGKIILSSEVPGFSGNVTSIHRLNINGTIDTSFLPTNTFQRTTALVMQPDGKVLVCSSHVYRLNVDGTIDYTMTNSFYAGARALALQDDSRFIVGGTFTQFGATKTNLIRLLTNGAVDPTFNCNVSGSWVNTVAARPNAQVVIGGSFTNINGIPWTNLARLNSDGSLDTNFSAVPNASTVAFDYSGKCYMVGNSISRALADGGLDPEFSPVTLSYAFGIALQQDGRPIIGGSFSTVQGAIKRRLARLNLDGTLDTTFAGRPAGPDQSVSAIAVLPDDHVFINCGPEVADSYRPNGISKLNSGGSIDTNFHTPAAEYYSGTRAIVIQTNGAVVVAGDSTPNIARLLPDGSPDPGWKAALSSSSIYSLALQPDGKICAGGFYVHRYNTDGTDDATFTNFYNSASTIALQSDGKLIVGSHGDGRVWRLNTNGTQDSTFGPGMSFGNSYIICEALQADGKILVGGYFTRFNGFVANHIARLNPDGSSDTNFTAYSTGYVFAIAPLPDGKALIGGQLSLYANGQSYNYLARLNSNGTVDTTFPALDLNGSVSAIALTQHGEIMIGGSFDGIGTLGQAYIARLTGDLAKLTISAVGSAALSVSWSVWWAGFTPQSTASLTESWLDAPEPVSNDGTNCTINVSPVSSLRFFRLRR
jgi:uncharacterized delta-60 repeat protein